MKRILIAAAATIALTALSCDKETGGTDPSGKKDPTTGKQEVTITCGQAQTRVTGTEDDSHTGIIEFKWEAGDYLYVTEGTLSPTYFAIKSGVESQKATFSGEVSEEAGESTKFSIQWPDKNPVPLESQTYVANGIQGEKMLATAEVTGLSTLKSSNIQLVPQYAVVRLDIKGDATLGTVTLTAGSDSYALSCTSVTLADATATRFYIVAKSTTTGSALSVNLKDSSSNDLGTFTTSKTDIKLKAGVTIKLGELTIYKDGTFTSTDFNAANWNSHESGGTGTGDFTGETW